MTSYLRFSTNQKLLLASLAIAGYAGHRFYTKSQTDLQKVQVFKNFNFTKYKQETPPLYTLKSRDDHIQDMANSQYDCLIIGGGCNGSGVLLEGSNRGLKCLMVEENDFSSGASSKSTKLIHGGIRYLAQVFEFSLEGHRMEKVKLLIEALHERCYMVDNAYYMNKVLPLVIPCRNIFFAMYNYIGCVLYHAIYKLQPTENASTIFPFPKWMGNDELKANFPHLDFKFKYGIVYYDAQMNDTRMNMDTILTSTINGYQKGLVGSNAVNYMRFESFLKDEEGKIIGANLYDRITDKTYTVKASCVVNCTGVFADKIRKLDDPNLPRRVLPVQGTHAIFPIKFTSKKMALLIPKTVDDRVLFIIPWLNSTLVGTTDIKIDQPVIEPAVKYAEMEFFYRELAKIYPALSTEYIVNSVRSKWAGLRPLVFDEIKEGEKVDSKKASRKHVIEKTKSGIYFEKFDILTILQKNK